MNEVTTPRPVVSAGESLPAAVGICLERRFILLEDDTTLKIVSMLDARGDETEDPAKAVVAIYQRPDERFGGVFVGLFDEEQRITPQ